MNKLVRSGLALASGFCATTLALRLDFDRAPSTKPGDRLGFLDFGRYCRDEYGSNADAINTSADAYGWKCAASPNGIFTTWGVDATAACSLLFGRNAYAESFDGNAADSWECFAGPRQP